LQNYNLITKLGLNRPLCVRQNADSLTSLTCLRS